MAELSFQDGIYRTPEQAATFPARLLPSVAFYGRLLRTVYRDSVVARLGGYDTATWSASSGEIFTVAERSGLDIGVQGLEHIQGLSGPAVIVGNHMSMLETLLLPAILCPVRRITYVLKEGLLAYPFFKHILYAIEVVAVTRTNPRQDLKIVMQEGCERLTRGLSVVVFPQTTRSHSFDPQQMNTIGIKLAKKAGVPVVPLALRTDALQNGKLIKDLGRLDPNRPVRFAFGAPLEVKGKGNEAHAAVVDFIVEKLAGWQ